MSHGDTVSLAFTQTNLGVTCSYCETSLEISTDLHCLLLFSHRLIHLVLIGGAWCWLNSSLVVLLGALQLEGSTGAWCWIEASTVY